MNKSKNIIIFVTILILAGLFFAVYKISQKNKNITQPHPETHQIVDNQPITTGIFFDGLPKPDTVINYPLDEFGMGIAQKSIYHIDINNDGTKDKITKTFIETGNAHSYYEYKVELNRDNKYIDITPNDLKTTNGDQCDLQQIRFSLKPKFSIKIIYRELGDSWNQPTIAKQKTLILSDDKIQPSETKTLKSVCDVKKLF